MGTNETTLNRRRAMVLTAAIAALPGAAPALAHNPDAELLALDAELERAWVTWWNLYGPTEDLNEQANEELSQHAGFSRVRMCMSDTEWREWWRVSNEVRERLGVNAANRARAVALEALEAIQQRIFEINPSTLPGMSVWARAVATTHHQLWWTEQCLEDGDTSDDRLLRRLIEALVAAGGLAMPADLVQA